MCGPFAFKTSTTGGLRTLQGRVKNFCLVSQPANDVRKLRQRCTSRPPPASKAA